MTSGPPATPESARRTAWPYVEIAVPVPGPRAVKRPASGGASRDATFTYAVPPAMDGRLGPGQLVWVPFGRQRLQGIVVALRRTTPVERTREVEAIVDPEPVLSVAQIALARWMNAHYLAPFFACLRAMLPPGALARTEERVRRSGQLTMPQALTDAQQAVLGTFGRDRTLTRKQIRARSGLKNPDPAVDALVSAGLLTTETRIAGPRVRPRRERMVRQVIEDADERDERLRALRRSPRADVVAYLRRDDVALPSPAEVKDATGASPAVLRGLIQVGLITVTEHQTLIEAAVSPDDADALCRTDLLQAPAQARLLVHLARATGPMPEQAALRAAESGPSALRRLVERGLARTVDLPAEVLLNVRGVRARAAEIDLRRLGAHAAVLDYLAAAGGMAAWRDIREATRAAARTLRGLEEAGLVIVADHQVWRDPLAGQAFERGEPLTLTEDQARAWDTIEPLLGRGSWAAGRPRVTFATRPQVCLVHGVTGSGKTELYLRAIEHVLFQGRQAIVLVPEIALTPQTINRFAGRFPGRVGVWHSELSDGERFDTWQRARDGRLDVIIGSRSAVFSPLPRLGLIVVDEAHADAYKQGATPRYHARDVSVRRAALSGAAVLLGTATPSLESYWAADHGAYRLVRMPRRVVVAEGHTVWADLPPVTVVDMRAELRSGNTSVFSRDLQDGLREALAQGEQAILFLNRRGSATFVSCRDCGHVQSCPRCRLPLTYHGKGRALVCHHCNHHEAPPMMCPVCGSPRIRYFGAGTQRIEAEVLDRFPDARVIRWDADTTGKRGAHGAILARFAGGGADVLIGTQMIAKGLDLPRVTLVGVVSADTALNLPDMRARERTFQLLSQVAGRAGRSSRGGRVVFQSYQPDDPAIRFAAEHDFEGFYRHELAFREQSGYPPFRQLVRLEHVTDRGDRAAEAAATDLADRLNARIERMGLPDTDVMGPAPAFFRYERGRVRWHLVVRSTDPHTLLGDVTLGPGWRVDVDPVSLL